MPWRRWGALEADGTVVTYKASGNSGDGNALKRTWQLQDRLVCFAGPPLEAATFHPQAVIDVVHAAFHLLLPFNHIGSPDNATETCEREDESDNLQSWVGHRIQTTADWTSEKKELLQLPGW